MSTAVATTSASELAVSSSVVSTVDRMESIWKESQAEIHKNVANPFRLAIVKAKAISLLEAALEGEVMELIMSLQGHETGFKTDATYDVDTVRRCAVHALLTGVQLTGNQFNIIAGNTYIAQKGCKFIIDNYPGLSDFRVRFAQPSFNDNKSLAAVSAFAKWKINGNEDSIEFDMVEVPGRDKPVDMRLAIRVNKGQGPDAILGKAKRKLFQAVVEQITGAAVRTVDDHFGVDEEAVVVDGQAQEKIEERRLHFTRLDVANITSEGDLNDYASKASEAITNDESLSEQDIAELHDSLENVIETRRKEIKK